MRLFAVQMRSAFAAEGLLSRPDGTYGSARTDRPAGAARTDRTDRSVRRDGNGGSDDNGTAGDGGFRD